MLNSSPPGASPTGRGRPRGFDAQAALDATVRVFWERGYSGASLDEVTAATGVHKPSLRAAFGGKDALYVAALDRYWVERIARTREVLAAAPTAAAAIAALLAKVVANLTPRPGEPRGCLRVNGALECDVPAVARAALQRMRSELGEAVGSRLERGRREGDLPSPENSAALAEAVVTLIDGLAVAARAGASAQQLEDTAALGSRLISGTPRSQRV